MKTHPKLSQEGAISGKLGQNRCLPHVEKGSPSRFCFAYLTYQLTACPTFTKLWRWTKARLPYKPPGVRRIVVSGLKLVGSRPFMFVVGLVVGLALYDIELGRLDSWLERQGLRMRVEFRDFDAETGMPLQPIYEEITPRSRVRI